MIGSHAWPIATLRPDGEVVPKERLLAQAGARKGAATPLRKRFVDEVARVTRLAFLDPRTTNLAPTLAVPHINVLRLMLHEGNVHASVLDAIDRTIPGPTLLELVSGGTVRLTGAYKRPAESGDGWVTGSHAIGESGPLATARPLPVATDLGLLYGHLLAGLWPTVARAGETLPEHAARIEVRAAAARSLAKAERALRAETMYARKVELNRKVRELRGTYDSLC